MKNRYPLHRKTADAMMILTLLITGCATNHPIENPVRNPAQNAVTPKPKYGSEAILLSQSHAYIQQHEAPDYWAISPYYLPQQDDHSCSVASITMVVNAAREGRKLGADDELATQQGVLTRVKDDLWNKGLSAEGHGVSLDQMKSLIGESLRAYQVENFTVTIVHTHDNSDATKNALHQALLHLESSPRHFMITNFIQGVFTGDADAGHFAPVGEYDAENRRVLIMDPDRQWYEPYWVSEDTFLKGMATHDPQSSTSRGYALITILK